METKKERGKCGSGKEKKRVGGKEGKMESEKEEKLEGGKARRRGEGK